MNTPADMESDLDLTSRFARARREELGRVLTSLGRPGPLLVLGALASSELPATDARIAGATKLLPGNIRLWMVGLERSRLAEALPTEPPTYRLTPLGRAAADALAGLLAHVTAEDSR